MSEFGQGAMIALALLGLAELCVLASAAFNYLTGRTR